jgi:hypothetical protein
MSQRIVHSPLTLSLLVRFPRSFLNILEELSLITTVYRLAFCHENWRAESQVWVSDVWLSDVWLSDVWVSDVWLSDVWVSDVSAQHRLCSAQCSFANNFVAFSPIFAQSSSSSRTPFADFNCVSHCFSIMKTGMPALDLNLRKVRARKAQKSSKFA